MGEKTAVLFRKAGISTVDDLLHHYPRGYVSYPEVIPLGEAEEGDRVSVLLRIVTQTEVRKGRRYTITSLSASDGTASCRMVWFNAPYLRSKFRKGETYVFSGILRIKGNFRVMEMPEVFTHLQYQKKRETLQPIYSLTAGLTNHMVEKTVRQALSELGDYPESLPEDALRDYGFMPLAEAIRAVHTPKEKEELGRAMSRLAFDEFLQFLLDVRAAGAEAAGELSSHPVSKEALTRLTGFLAGQPFSLTEGQKRAVDDIAKDMASTHVMNRLIQGDVGSGKTMVAMAAVYLTLSSGYQAAFMVPTEVLAEQHFREISEKLKPYKFETALLTGAVSAAEKRRIREGLSSGEIRLVIGTHALLEDPVQFQNLGLVITDEQHRFGVKQREKLSAKGAGIHTLLMSATPIPRTLAMILYADMHISEIRELPKGRKRIKNCVVDTSYRPTAWNFIRKEVMAGHQAYVICPMVEESDRVEGEDVISYADELSGTFGENIRVDFLHGRMKEEEKNRIMRSFAAREIDVLVSTTVIEVGINNPNATVMMIENAERFGLAQLHQLRGRVGRGDAQSYCIFISGKKSAANQERLKVLEESNDGFEIAAKDLMLRGPGEFYGIRQSGELDFRIADIYSFEKELKLAQECMLKYGDRLVSKHEGKPVL